MLNKQPKRHSKQIIKIQRIRQPWGPRVQGLEVMGGGGEMEIVDIRDCFR